MLDIIQTVANFISDHKCSSYYLRRRIFSLNLEVDCVRKVQRETALKVSAKYSFALCENGHIWSVLSMSVLGWPHEVK